MFSYFLDPMGHKLRGTTDRYIVKMFCHQCQKIYDKRECRKYIHQGNRVIVKQRGIILEQYVT